MNYLNNSFLTLQTCLNKYKLDIKNYALPNFEVKTTKLSNVTSNVTLESVKDVNANLEKLYAFPKECVEEIPKLCTFTFMNKNELIEYFNLKNYKDIRQAISARKLLKEISYFFLNQTNCRR